MVANTTDDPLPKDLINNVDKACELILGVMDLNGITKSEAVSAMATMIVNILAHYDDPKHFNAVIKMMDEAFKELRKP